MNRNYVTFATWIDPMYQQQMDVRRKLMERSYAKMAFHAAIMFTLNWIDSRKALIEKLESGWVNPLANKYPGYTSEYLIDKSSRFIAACEECLTRADMSWEVIHSSDGNFFFPELLDILRKHGC